MLNGINTISASNIYVGNDVNESEEKGDVIIDSGAIVFDASNSVFIKNGFTCTKGATLIINPQK